MQFGAVSLDLAEGAILAHSIEPGGTRLRKGKVLTRSDIARLAQAGMTEVIVARPGPDDTGEDSAATLIGAALAGPGLRATVAATGRVNLIAEGPGVLAIDTAAVAAMNAIDPMITLATLPAFARVGPGDMVATVKIIAYAASTAAVGAAADAARGALALCPPVLQSACLIETVLTQTGRAPSAKGRTATQARLARLGVRLSERIIVAHDAAAIAAALSGVADDLVLLLTASATSDAADVGPAALIAAGGRLERFGLPVDPGNLLFLGALGQRPVIGLPGCARSMAQNGADWVLDRTICGIAPTAAQIAAMGVGGLLKEVAARGRPREL